VVLDQQRTFGDAIAEWLAAKPGLTVVAAVTSVQAARRVLIGRHVDVIVIDGELPDGATMSLCVDLSERSPLPRAVILSDSADPELIAAAFRSGAVAWVGKDEPMKHLLGVILGAARGEAWIPPVLLRQVIRVFLHDQVKRRDDPLSALTQREREVLSLIAHGYGRKQVAEQMHLSVNTVRTHMRSLLAKLGVHSALEAVALIGSHPPQSEAFQDNPMSEDLSLRSVFRPERGGGLIGIAVVTPRA
jgi:DNA-binding NarL/FixJ family response regulator